MKKFITFALAIAVVALTVPTALGADMAELHELLRALPNRCAVVGGIPDVPRTIAAWKRWARPQIGALFGEEMGRVLTDLSVILTGPAVAGWADDGTLLLLATTKQSQAELAKALAPHLDVNEEGGIIRVSVPFLPEWFCVVRQGRIIASNVRPFPGMPAADQSILATPDGEALLKAETIRDASLFVFKRPGLPRGLDVLSDPAGRNRTAALQRRLLAASGLQSWMDAPSLTSLQLGERTITLKSTTLAAMAAGPVVPGSRPRAGKPFTSLSAACPICVRGAGVDFASLVDTLASAMARFDPDVAAEFREEMAELNRDLGYDFQRDLLRMVGPDWACGILPPDGGGEVEWVFACGLTDAGKFTRYAARLAEISNEPWSEKAPQNGGRRFATRAFTIPLEIGVTTDALLIAPSAQALGRTLNLLKTGPAVETRAPITDAAARVWEIRAVGQWAGIAQILPDKGESVAFRNAWSRLPETARVTLESRLARKALHSQLRFEGLRPEGLPVLLEPFFRSLAVARERAMRGACMGNIKQITWMVSEYQKDHGRFPAHLSDLIPEYVPDESLLQCPAAAKRIGPDGKALPSYHYVGSVPALDLRLSSETIIMYDLRGNHPGGRNVGYYDSHVEQHDEAAFRQELARSLQSVKEAIAKAEKEGRKLSFDMKVIEAFYNDPPMIQK